MNYSEKNHSLFQVGIKYFAVIFCVLIWQTTASAQTLKADYQFQGNLNSSVAGAPAMTNINGTASFQLDTVDGYARQTVRFPANSGLSLNTLSLIPGNAYTVVMLFRFDTVSNRRRVFDAQQGTSNPCGLYISASRLEPEPTGTTLIYPDTYIQVTIVREANGAIRFHRDGFTTALPTDSNCYLNSNNNLRFFVDDSVVPGENSAGNVARIRVYDAPMTAAQVRALDRPANANGGGDQAILFNSFRDGNSEIYSMNSNGANQRRLTNNTVADYNARWSPDKTKIVFTRDSAATTEQIWIMNADGSGQTALTNSTSNDHGPTWKPDGSTIVFSRCNASFVCDLYTMNPDGTNQQQFNGATSPENDEDVAAYSPDGSKIVYSRIPVDPAIPTSGLYSLNTTGAAFNRLTSPASPVGDRDSRYSPNGSKIAFSRFPDIINGTNANGIEIYTMNADGTNLTNITNNSFLDNTPVWSPSGTRLGFHSNRNIAVNEIYSMDAANGGNVERLTFNSSIDQISDWFSSAITNRTPFDFDGDGRADLSVFRPSSAVWFVNSSGGGFSATNWGVSSDKLAPADYDGDGRTDYAVWREDPADGDRANFYILNSFDNTVRISQFGRNGDDPLVVGDWDGDQKADLAVYRNGAAFGQQSFFYYRPSSQSGVSFVSVSWGVAGDRPLQGDFDGDGKLDAAVFRPSNATWYIRNSLDASLRTDYWGGSSDKFVPADYDGDSKTDLAVFRNGTWYIKQSTNNQARYETFGLSSDTLAPADYDGDDKVDLAVFRNGIWYLLQSTGGFSTTTFGLSSDTPVPSVYTP